MNVDEAMETAKAYLVAREQMQEPLFESEEVAVTLAREVERLRVWKTRWKDAAQKLRRQLEESGDGDTWRRACRRVELELEKTHTEVERLRAELELSKANVESLKKALFEVQEAAIRLGDQVDNAKAELAAAKSASVCPVKWKSVEQFFQSGAERGNQWGVEFWFENKEQREQFHKWMKERGEG